MSRLRFFIWIFTKTFLGGILCYLDFLVLVSKWPLKKHCGVDSTYVYYVFLFLLLIILLWYTRHKMQGEKILRPFNFRWVFGFGRIFSGSMNEEPIMSTFTIFFFRCSPHAQCANSSLSFIYSYNTNPYPVSCWYALFLSQFPQLFWPSHTQSFW